MRIGRHADDRLDTRSLGIHQRYEVDDVFDATIDAGDVSPVREGGTVAHLTGKHVADLGLGGFDQNVVAKGSTAQSLMSRRSLHADAEYPRCADQCALH